jgi:hypothetical protein
VLEQSSDEAKVRFSALLDGHGRHDHSTNHVPVGSTSAIDVSSTELRLAHDPAIGQMLSWLDERVGWLTGSARRRVADQLAIIDPRHLQDRAHRRSRVGRQAIADGLASYYGPTPEGYHGYAATCQSRAASTSILTRPGWLDLRLPLGSGRDHLELRWDGAPARVRLDKTAADAAARRVAEALATDTQVVNSSLYQLLDLTVSGDALTGAIALTDFIEYALTMDLLENELVDLLADGRRLERGRLPLRDSYLPTISSVIALDRRLCAGGALALFAAARPASRGRPRGDYVLLVQERSGRVLNAARRLAVIPKSFHEPLTDFSDDAQISATLEREMEEELFGRTDVDSTLGERRHADPLHLSRLSPPMRWLMDHLDEQPPAWRTECTGFGLNLVSGNFEFASLIVVDDETWWAEFGGSVEANWESDGLRRYSSLDHDGIAHLVHDASWSNEGLFAFVQGIRRLAEIGEDRVNLPSIELETR